MRWWQCLWLQHGHARRYLDSAPTPTQRQGMDRKLRSSCTHKHGPRTTTCHLWKFINENKMQNAKNERANETTTSRSLSACAHNGDSLPADNLWLICFLCQQWRHTTQKMTRKAHFRTTLFISNRPFECFIVFSHLSVSVRGALVVCTSEIPSRIRRQRDRGRWMDVLFGHNFCPLFIRNA